MNSNVYKYSLKLIYNVNKFPILSRSNICSRLFDNSRCILYNPTRHKNTTAKDISAIVQPITISPTNDNNGVNVGEELSGVLKKGLNK